MSPKVSIVIPIYNVEAYLGECLDSVVNQTMREIQIIGVNDGSTDNSPAILQEYADRDSRIEIIDQSNGGVSAARNAAFSRIQGKYTLFVDSDDWIEPDLCEKTYQKSEASGADMTFFYFKRPGMKQASSIFRSLNPQDKTTPEQKVPLARYCFPVLKLFSIGFLRDHDIRFPLNSRYEDIFFHWQALTLANKVAILPEPLYNYRERPGSMLSSGDTRYYDIVPIFDLTKQFLVQHGFYETWRAEFLRFKLTMYRECYQNIQRCFKSEMLEQIKKSLGEEDREFYRSAGTLKKREVRFFQGVVESRRLERMKYHFFNALQWPEYLVKSFFIKPLRAFRASQSGKVRKTGVTANTLQFPSAEPDETSKRKVT